MASALLLYHRRSLYKLEGKQNFQNVLAFACLLTRPRLLFRQPSLQHCIPMMLTELLWFNGANLIAACKLPRHMKWLSWCLTVGKFTDKRLHQESVLQYLGAYQVGHSGDFTAKPPLCDASNTYLASKVVEAPKASSPGGSCQAYMVVLLICYDRHLSAGLSCLHKASA